MKIPINQVVVVEGKYDKIKLDSVIDADIITLDGFGVFKSDEKKALIRKAAEKRGVIVLTDSDSAGLVIRNHIKSIAGTQGITHLYIPQIEGKEKRKISPSKEGLLGVEGVDVDTLKKLSEDSDEIADSIRQGHIAYVINTSDPSSSGVTRDGFEIRKYATENNVTMFTSLDTVRVLLDVLEETTLTISTIDA